MPHTSHKKHRVPPAKRREITDLHGWTHVTRSPNSNSNKCLTRPDVLQPTTIPSGLTLENVEARYQEYSRRWKASTCWSDMERFFRQTILASDSLTITSCVCLGLGSFTGSHVSSSLQSSGTDASMYELVALKTMLDLLRGNGKHSVKDVYFQDPSFNALDERFIQSLGFTVLESPRAIGRLTSTSFLFAPRLEFPIIYDALAAATPVLYVGNDLREDFSVASRWSESEKKTFKTFADSRSREAMPLFDLNMWCSHQSIYWKPECVD
ncbi:hypothetical protein MMC24_005905 [Lignoscripta atroalba]|nr:hypothetical protein [Lignoscripta atroalba]